MRGGCAENQADRDFCVRGKPCIDKIREAIEGHFFYSAIENSDCYGYITEKTYDRIEFNSIPIVMRRDIYEKNPSMPPSSQIFVDDFESSEEMAVFLRSLQSNKTAYMSYFKYRERYGVDEKFNVYWDALCAQLNDPNSTLRNSKKTIPGDVSETYMKCLTPHSFEKGNYTPENFANAPHHFVVAVANAKPEDLIKYKASYPYREILSYRLKPGRDFFEVFINETAHLMPISAYKKEGDVFYPVDATFHNRLWRNSKKLECLMGHPDMKGVEPKLLPKDLEWLAAFRDLCFEKAVIPFLAKRTLLGWRRQCALLPAAGGFDLNVFDEEFPDALIADEAKLATRRLRVEHTFGKRRSGTYEVHLTSMEPAARPFEILLNPMYNGNDGYNFETMITGEGDDAVLWDLEYPWFVKNFCTAALHGHIFHVPCDPYQLILANYGPNWDDIDDYKLKNARKLGPLNDRKWQRPNV
ncbi:unnamed protein product, partial [Mesorhabditis spiculigera]